MTDNVPNYIFKLALTDDNMKKSMVELLHDFGIELDEDKALKLFYSIIAHLIYYLDVHPGHYFKLNFIDIVSDKNSFLSIKRGSDYTEDMVTPQMFYNKFSGKAVLQAELKETIDLFTKSFLGIKEDKQRERRQIDKFLDHKRKLIREMEECKENVDKSVKQKKAILKKRQEESRLLKKEAKRKGKACRTKDIEYYHRDRLLKLYNELEVQLRELWEENISLKEMLDKTQ